MMTHMSSKTRNWILGIVAAVVLLGVGGPFVYINFINDPAPEIGFDDLDGTTTTTGSTDGTTGTTTASEPVEPGEVGGEYVVAGGEVQYRVPETLAGQSTEGVGSTDDVTGTLVLDGTTVTAVDVEVDMTTVTSDRSQRDGQFHGRILNTREFPTATFTLTEPIELGELPADGQEVTVEATGDLTIRGVTQSVTFELAARRSGASVQIDTDIEIDFDAFEIPDASGGPASVGRTGTLEVLLSFDPA